MRCMGMPGCAVLILALVATSAAAAEAGSEAGQHTFDLNPIVIDSKDGTGSTIGVEFNLSGDLLQQPAAAPAASSDTFEDPDKVLIKHYSVHYEVKGVAAADAERNPLNYIDAIVDGSILRNTPSYTLMGGAFVRYETDQSQDNRQSEYGLGGTIAKRKIFDQNDQLALDVRFGEVDPKEDEVREAALGTNSLDKFYRWDAEFLYMLPLSSDGALRDLEFNYRYYLEDDPPAAIKATDLDVHRMATVRLGLKGGLFIAYSRGKLPFDQESDRIYAIGFSYQLY